MAGIDASDLKKGLLMFETKAQKAIRMYAETSAVKMEAHAQDNAEWEDRSGDARKRLKGSVEIHDNGYAIVLAHGVDYGIWLELAHEKKFAIIQPTINEVGEKKIMPGFHRLLERLE